MSRWAPRNCWRVQRDAHYNDRWWICKAERFLFWFKTWTGWRFYASREQAVAALVLQVEAEEESRRDQKPVYYNDVNPGTRDDLRGALSVARE